MNQPTQTSAKKLDTAKAWSDATGMISANKDLAFVLGGIFLFLPVFAMMLGLFNAELDFGPSDEPNPELIAEQINALLLEYWWVLAIVSLGQLCAAITVLSVLGDPARPTVGDVMKRIPALLLPMFAAQILTAIVIQVLPTIADFVPGALGGFLGLILFPVSVYLAVKFALTSPVIVIDAERNPIKAMRRSWTLTKGNSFRIFVFFAMLIVVAFVLSLIGFLIAGLVFAIIGGTIQTIGNAVIVAAAMAAFYTVSYAVVAAMHTQLAAD